MLGAEGARKNMQKYTYHGACVRYRTIQGGAIGVMEVCYSGLLTLATFAHLWRKQNEETAGAPALVVRLDRAVLLFGEPPQPRAWAPPAALIVREDQYPTACAFARNCAAVSVVRAIFLTEQAEQAFQWAEAHGQAGSARPRSWRPRRPESGFAPLALCLAIQPAFELARTAGAFLA